MQPTQTEVGHHNQTLASSAARFVEGATWKQQRVVWLIPSANMIHAKAVFGWLNLMTPPNQPRVPIVITGEEVGKAYSDHFEWVINHPDLGQYEYILTMEHDNAPQPDGLLRLIRQMEAHPEFQCIGGLYWTKGEGGCPQIWGDAKDPVINFRPQPPVPGQLVECCGTGMGFNLWRIAAFKKDWAKLPKPLFKTKCSPEEGVGTQDLAFWAEAKKIGWRCAIDCGVLVSHIDPKTGFAW